MNRRIYNSRAVERDPASMEGYDPPLLEGDPLLPGSDAVSSLRPFGRDVPELALGVADASEAPGDVALRQAGELARQGRRLEAVLLLRQWTALEPGHLPARVALAGLLGQAGEVGAAIEELSVVVRERPQDAEVLVQRGALYAHSGQAALAEADFRGARDIDPSHCAATRYLGVTLLRRGLAGEALGVLAAAEGLAPDDPEVKLALGEALGAAGRMEEALRTLAEASALDPDDPRPLTLAGRILDRLGRSEEALAMHRKAREVTRP